MSHVPVREPPEAPSAAEREVLPHVHISVGSDLVYVDVLAGQKCRLIEGVVSIANADTRPGRNPIAHAPPPGRRSSLVGEIGREIAHTDGAGKAEVPDVVFGSQLGTRTVGVSGRVAQLGQPNTRESLKPVGHVH